MSVFQNPIMNYQPSPMAQQLLALAAQARMQSAARTSEALHNIGQSIGGGMAEAGRIKLAAAMQRRKELNEAFQFGADMAMKAIMQNAAMKHERELAGEERTSRENIAREEMGTRRDIAKQEMDTRRDIAKQEIDARRQESAADRAIRQSESALDRALRQSEGALNRQLDMEQFNARIAEERMRTAADQAFRRELMQLEQDYGRERDKQMHDYRMEERGKDMEMSDALMLKIAGADYEASESAVNPATGQADPQAKATASATWLARRFPVLYNMAQSEETRKTLIAQAQVMLSDLPGTSWESLPDVTKRLLGLPTSEDAWPVEPTPTAPPRSTPSYNWMFRGMGNMK